MSTLFWNGENNKINFGACLEHEESLEMWVSIESKISNIKYVNPRFLLFDVIA